MIPFSNTEVHRELSNSACRADSKYPQNRKITRQAFHRLLLAHTVDSAS